MRVSSEESWWRIPAPADQGATVLSRRYGFRSLGAVGETLGASRERVRQLQNATLSELRQRELGLEGWPPGDLIPRLGFGSRRLVGAPEPVEGLLVEGSPDELHPHGQT